MPVNIALNGLFAIDDTKDPDTDEHKKTVDKGIKSGMDEAAAALKDCETMEALHEVWIGLSNAERDHCTIIKDAMKKKIQESA